MKRLLALLALLLLADPVAARVWYVADATTSTPAGDAGNPGTSSGAPTTLTVANAGVSEGDVVYLAAGDYGESINPSMAGSADLGKIYYIGTFGVGDTVSVPAVNFYAAYISISGVTITGTVNIYAAHDSLDYCYVMGGANATATADYFHLNKCTFVSDTAAVVNFGGATHDTLANYLTGGVIDSCSFTIRHTLNADVPAVCFQDLDGLTMSYTSFAITVGPTGDHGICKVYNMENSLWSSCAFTATMQRASSSCDECANIYYRDYTRRNVFLNCTWDFPASSHPILHYLSASGSAPRTNRNNSWRYCEWRSAAPIKPSGFLWFQDGMRSDSLYGCTVVSPNAPALAVYNTATVDSFTMAHNTFIRIATDTMIDGAPYYGDESAHVIQTETIAGSGFTAHSNIFYMKDGATETGSSAAVWSAGSIISDGDWTGDYNLWYGETGPDSVVWSGGSPVDSTALRALSVEAACVYGNPIFLGGTPTVAGALTFDARLSDASPAIGKGESGSDIGAWDYAALEDSFTVTWAASAGGSIVCDSCNVDGDGNKYETFPKDSCSFHVIARHDEHYNLVDWSDYSTDSTRWDCYPVADVTYTANFEPDSFTVQYDTDGNGTISGTAYQRVAYGEDATQVTAVADTGYHFVRWMPDSLATAARTDTTITADTTFTAYFGLNTYTLYYLDSPSDHGTISGVTTQMVSHGGNGTEVEAVPDAGYHFVIWSDSVLTAARIDSSVTANLFVRPTYAITTYALIYRAASGGTIVGDTSQVVNYLGAGSLVTATPSTGYAFYSWDDSLKTAARVDALIEGDTTVTAIFNSIATPAGEADISLASTATTLRSQSHDIVISSTGTDSLHVYSVKLYHVNARGRLIEVPCVMSSGAQTIAAGASATVSVSHIALRWRGQPTYRVVVTSDAGTATLSLTYDPCG